MTHAILPHDVRQAARANVVAAVFELDGKTQIIRARWALILGGQLTAFPFRFGFSFPGETNPARRSDLSNAERRKRCLPTSWPVGGLRA